MFEDLKLSELEIEVLKSFNQFGELIHPWATFNSVPKRQISRSLERLIAVNLIMNTKPYKLTKKGKRWLAHQKSSA